MSRKEFFRHTFARNCYRPREDTKNTAGEKQWIFHHFIKLETAAKRESWFIKIHVPRSLNTSMTFLLRAPSGRAIDKGYLLANVSCFQQQVYVWHKIQFVRSSAHRFSSPWMQNIHNAADFCTHILPLTLPYKGLGYSLVLLFFSVSYFTFALTSTYYTG